MLSLQIVEEVYVLNGVRARESNFSCVLQEQGRVKRAFYKVTISHLKVIGLSFIEPPEDSVFATVSEVPSQFVSLETLVEILKVAQIPFIWG